MKRTDRFIHDCKSWDDFYQRNNSLPEGEKGANFERLVQLYLQTRSEYANNNLTDVWMLRDVPTDVRRELNLPSRDEGIDLIARDVRGKYWAIQAKFRSDPNQPLTRLELGTFISCAFNTCRKIKLAVIAHTCTKPPSKRDLMKNTIEFGLDRWREADWSLILKAIEGKSARPKQRSPRKYQKPAIAAAQEHFLRNKETRGRLIMP